MKIFGFFSDQNYTNRYIKKKFLLFRLLKKNFAKLKMN